jgi:hypothetical protein
MFRAPSQAGLPGLHFMLDDLHATPKQIATHLGIKESTLATYKRTGNAPRAVQLALFWETQWGRSAADVEAANAAAVHAREARALQAHQARMAGVIWRLEVELDRTTGGRPANLPIWKWG